MWLSYSNKFHTRTPPLYPADDARPVYGQRRGCPRCGRDLLRVRRRYIDRILSLAIPVHRYHCLSMGCGWKGNIRVRSD